MNHFTYAFAAHPTLYKDVMFRSRLEARWAAFFDLVDWGWQYEPYDLKGWTPDFLVRFECGHSECAGFHELLVEVKPFSTVGEFEGHPCMDHAYGDGIPADASAAFGICPNVTHFEMVHGAGGGAHVVEDFVRSVSVIPPRGCEAPDNGIYDLDLMWTWAGNTTRWKP
jgi:hypothetical protein